MLEPPAPQARNGEVLMARGAPAPVGAYPPARRVGELLYLSGVGPRQPGTDAIPGGPVRDPQGQPLPYDVKAQTRATIEDARAILAAAGSSLDKVVDVTAFLIDMDRDFTGYNEVYKDYFAPIAAARTTLASSAPPTPIAVELEVIARASPRSGIRRGAARRARLGAGLASPRARCRSARRTWVWTGGSVNSAGSAIPEEGGCEGDGDDGGDVPPPVDPGAPLWRREPYRVLFPLGIVLGWVGVVKWLLLAWKGIGTYASADHSTAQILGFMMCFATGFLLTAIPRRTSSAPASAGVIAVAAIAPVVTTVAAMLERFSWSVMAWLVLVGTLFVFAVRRLRGSGLASRRPPNGFVWVPLSFLMGLVGSLMMALRALGPDWRPSHAVGKGLLVQGLFVGLILGVGSMVIPLVTRGAGPPDGEATGRDRLARLGHVVCALLLAGSFVIEEYVHARAGLALRGGVALLVLVVAAGLHHPPTVPGLHRWVVWLGAWCVPAGLFLAAAFPAQRAGALHLLFVGGFAGMALAVGAHVTMAHAGDEQLVRGRPWQVVAFGLLLLLATGLRLAMTFDPARLWTWMASASAAFLLATVAWAALALPRLTREGEE